ncbi:MAG TPA: preprotein translocase subunit YajC [Acidimicrobiales bacterium]|nr:preprotein translocase subunit YajC [Acidimicrobiales bacterium]
MGALILLIVMFGLMWLLLIRPQKAQLQRHKAFLETLKPGDEVMTAGGTLGRLVDLDAREGRLEIAPGVVVRVLKQRLLAVPGAAVEAAAHDELTVGDEDDE